jgi:hypothetical protein
MESQEAGLPCFPHSLEIPSGFPHSHGLGCWHISRCKSMRDRSQGLLDLKGLVTDVSGPQRNACPGTLTPQEGLVSLHLRRAQKDAFEFVLWVGIAGREELVTKLSSRGVNGTHLLLLASSGCGWLTASPYIKRGFVDSTFYSHTSMLKTMELILGLKPMSIFVSDCQ